MAEEAKKEEKEIEIEVKKADESSDERSPEQKLIDELKGSLESATRRAEAAEATASSERAQKEVARSEVKTAAQRQIETQEAALISSINGTKSAFEAAQREWDEAYDAGDKAKLRAAQEKLNDAQMAMRGAEFEKGRFDKWKEANKNAPVETAREPSYTIKSATGDDFTLPQAGKDWVNKHSKFTTDPEYAEEVVAANAKAMTRRIKAWSPEHFEFIENHLKKVGLEDSDEVAPPKKETATSKKAEKQSTAAPPGGSTGSNSGGSKKQTITLTSEQRRAAQIVFPDEYKKDPAAAEAKYAKYQLEMKNKG